MQYYASFRITWIQTSRSRNLLGEHLEVVASGSKRLRQGKACILNTAHPVRHPQNRSGRPPPLMRSIWKRSISFGLVNIPVAVYPAMCEQKVNFRLLRKSNLSPGAVPEGRRSGRGGFAESSKRRTGERRLCRRNCRRDPEGVRVRETYALTFGKIQETLPNGKPVTTSLGAGAGVIASRHSHETFPHPSLLADERRNRLQRNLA